MKLCVSMSIPIYFLLFLHRRCMDMSSFQGSWPQLLFQGLLSKLEPEDTARSLLEGFSQEPEAATERAVVDIEQLRPSCFRAPTFQSHVSYPSMVSGSSDEEADFEQQEASPTILNSMQRHGVSSRLELLYAAFKGVEVRCMRKCLRTPRHPGTLAAQLLRKAYLCLYLRSPNDGSKSRKGSKHVPRLQVDLIQPQVIKASTCHLL